MSYGLTPSPTDSDPCGSKSTSSTLRPYSARAAPRLIVVVVLPTPPFWLHIEMIRAGPWLSRATGSGKSGIGRFVGPIGRPAATACGAECSTGFVSSTGGIAWWAGCSPASGGVNGWVLTWPSSQDCRLVGLSPYRPSGPTVGRGRAATKPPRRCRHHFSVRQSPAGSAHAVARIPRDSPGAPTHHGPRRPDPTGPARRRPPRPRPRDRGPGPGGPGPRRRHDRADGRRRRVVAAV